MRDGETTNDTADDAICPGFAECLGQRLARVRSYFAPLRRAVGFGVAAAVVGITLRILLNDPGARFSVLYPTVALAALIAGPVAGLTTTFLATLAAEALYFHFLGAGGVATTTDLVVFANFVFTGTMISLVAAADRSSSRRLAREGRAADIRHRTVVDALHDGVIVFGRDGAVLDHNPAAERILGHPAGSLARYPPGFVGWGLYREDGTEMTVAEYPAVRVATTGKPAEGEVLGVRRGTDLVWLLNNASPIVDPATGEVTAVVVSFADVTDRYRTRRQIEEKERQLVERDEELHQTLDAAGLGVWWCDVATGLVHVDPRSRSLFGTPETEAITSLAERFHPDDGPLLRDLRDRLGRSDGGSSMTLRRPDSEGTLKWLSLTARLRRKIGGGEEIWGTVQDVTETRRAEEALRRFEASRRLEALGRMTGGIAHDLNNLLTVVSGNLQLLEMSPESADAERWIAEALRASESGAALNERLLTFARRRRLEPTLTNLNDLVGGMVDMLHRSIGPSITVTTVLGGDLGAVRVDPAEIENAILNLVLNARDAMPNGGRIAIETADTTLDRSVLPPEEGIRPGDFVRLSVTDDGQGMTPEVKARAFEPFFTTKDVGRGSGLGLSTLHGFVRQSGGFVTLYSEPGLGTAVNVFLPRVAAAGEHPGAAKRPQPARGAGQTILVVEDDPDVRRVDREELEALCYRVVTAGNAAEASAALATGRQIDLVFTDVVMPGGTSGLDLAHRLVTEDPGRRVLLTSGFAGDFIATGNAAQIDFPFLRKPHSMTELADAVVAALRPPPPAS